MRDTTRQKRGTDVTVVSVALILAIAPTMTASGQMELASRGKEVRPLPIDVVLHSASFPAQGPIGAISPDGRRVAYTVLAGTAPLIPEGGSLDFTETGGPRSHATASVWLLDLPSGKSWKISGAQGAAWSPAWSPDGRSLAFYSDRDGAPRIWVWSAAADTVRRVSGVIARPFSGVDVPLWTRDSRSLVAKVLPEGESLADVAGLRPPPAKPPTESTTVIVYTAHAAPLVRPAPAVPGAGALSAGSALDWRFRSDLALIDVATGEVRRLVRNRRVLRYRLSPDGRFLAFVNLLGTMTNTAQGVSDIGIVPVGGGPARLIAREQSAGDVHWSPDGSMIACISHADGPASEIFVAAADSGAVRQLTHGGHPPFRTAYWAPDGTALYSVAGDRVWKIGVADGRVQPVTAPSPRRLIRLITTADGSAIWTIDGGRSLIVEARDRLSRRSGFAKVDLATGHLTTLREDDQSYGRSVVSPDGAKLVYAAEDAAHPVDLWLTDGRFQRPRRITQINPEFGKYELGRARIIEYYTDDGELLQGALLLPAGFESGKRYPLIARIYPSPGSRDDADKVNNFGIEGPKWINNLQMYATRGYAVLVPAAPTRTGTPVRDMAAAILPAVNKVIEMGVADPARLAVMGHSYGGYSTLAMITQTTRFKAAVVGAGAGDLFSSYGHFRDGRSPWISWAEDGQGAMGGTPWEVRERYIENSPLFYLDRVTTPLLLIQGDRDPAVPAWAAGEIFSGMRRLGKEVEYRLYPGESHVPLAEASLRDYWVSVLRWFDTYLKPDTSAVSVTSTGRDGERRSKDSDQP